MKLRAVFNSIAFAAGRRPCSIFANVARPQEGSGVRTKQQEREARHGTLDLARSSTMMMEIN
jgi:hypothetical protein